MSSPPAELLALRHRLHRLAERSGEERRTADAVREFLSRQSPGRIEADLGGHGVAAVWDGPSPGPTVLLRADLDALPLPESLALPHGSLTEGVAHKCGHDGHMAMLAGVGVALAQRPPARGRAVLLFQPAEETGAGARAVLDDPRFAAIAPDRVLALHNLPGFPTGSVLLRDGVFASASRGLAVTLRGVTSHAAEPAAGRSPALAVAQLIADWSAAPQLHSALAEAAQVTVIHARVGERAFGTSPGEGCVMATLRAHETAVLERLAAHCEERARGLATAHGLEIQVDWVEPFPATCCDPGTNAVLEAVARERGLVVRRLEHPFPWSEDFGHFTAVAPGALFGLGAGPEQPALHHPRYDFPDALLAIGPPLLEAALRRLLALDKPATGGTP